MPRPSTPASPGRRGGRRATRTTVCRATSRRRTSNWTGCSKAPACTDGPYPGRFADFQTERQGGLASASLTPVREDGATPYFQWVTRFDAFYFGLDQRPANPGMTVRPHRDWRHPARPRLRPRPPAAGRRDHRRLRPHRRIAPDRARVRHQRPRLRDDRAQRLRPQYAAGQHPGHGAVANVPRPQP